MLWEVRRRVPPLVAEGSFPALTSQTVGDASPHQHLLHDEAWRRTAAQGVLSKGWALARSCPAPVAGSGRGGNIPAPGGASWMYSAIVCPSDT